MPCSKFTSVITPSTQDALIDGIESMLVTNGGFTTVSKTNITRSGTTFWGNNVAGGNVRELRIGKASIGLYLTFRCWRDSSNNRFALWCHICNSTFSTIFPAESTSLTVTGFTHNVKTAGLSNSAGSSSMSGFDSWVHSLRSTVDLTITLWMHSSLDNYFVLTLDHELRGGLGPGNQATYCCFKVCEDVQTNFDAVNNWIVVGRASDSSFSPAALGQQLVPTFNANLDDSWEFCFTPNFNSYSSGTSPVITVEGFGLFLARSPAGAGIEAPNYFGNFEIIKNCWRTYLNWINRPNRTAFAMYNYVGRLHSDLAIGPGGLVGPTGQRIIVTPGVEEYDLTSSKPSPNHFPYGPTLYVRAV